MSYYKTKGLAGQIIQRVKQARLYLSAILPLPPPSSFPFPSLSPLPLLLLNGVMYVYCYSFTTLLRTYMVTSMYAINVINYCHCIVQVAIYSIPYLFHHGCIINVFASIIVVGPSCSDCQRILPELITVYV